VLDGVVNSAPAVQSVIEEGKVSITGNFTLEDAKGLKTVLDSGSLPVTLGYSESRVVGPTLGQDSLNQGVFAIGIGVAIVVVYLFVFYRGLGILTRGSLGVFAVLYLGILALLSHFGAFALTLPGLAGIVLTTGSAADSSILVLERFREEIRMGRSIKNAAVSGAKHGIMTSLDADAVQMVAALALFFVAVGSVKGFGLTLALGIVCDVVTMFCFKAPALRLLALKAIPNNPKFWGVSQDLADAESAKEARAEKGGVANASPLLARDSLHEAQEGPSWHLCHAGRSLRCGPHRSRPCLWYRVPGRNGDRLHRHGRDRHRADARRPRELRRGGPHRPDHGDRRHEWLPRPHGNH
jgi:preprotein translocase subunit SecD/SecD/SecF fusion protein